MWFDPISVTQALERRRPRSSHFEVKEMSESSRRGGGGGGGGGERGGVI